MCGVSSVTELRDPPLCLSVRWNSPLFWWQPWLPRTPSLCPPARKMPGLLAESQLRQPEVRLLCDRTPPSGQSPQSRKLPHSPHFESPLQPACFQYAVQNPQVIGFCLLSRICSCFHWDSWSIGSVYNKTRIKSSVLPVFSLCIIKLLCVLDELTPLTL